MDDTWMKILYALPLILMAFFIFPRAKQMLKNAPKATNSDWKSFLIPIVFVTLFVFFLIKMV